MTSSSAPSSTSSPASTRRGCAPRSSARRREVAHAALDTEGYQVVDLHLARAEATPEEQRARADPARARRHARARARRRRPRARRAARRVLRGAVAKDLDSLLRLARAHRPLERAAARRDDSRSSTRPTTPGRAGCRELAVDVAAPRRALPRGRLPRARARDRARRPARRTRRSSCSIASTRRVLGARSTCSPARGPRRGRRARRAVSRDGRDLRASSSATTRARSRPTATPTALEPDHPDVLDAIARLYARIGGMRRGRVRGARAARAAIAEPKRARERAGPRRRRRAELRLRPRAGAVRARALADDPDLVAAVDGLALLLRDRGELAGIVALLEGSAARPALAPERSRWLTDAADFCVATRRHRAREGAVPRGARGRSDEPQGRARARRAVLGHRLARRARADPRRAVRDDRRSRRGCAATSSQRGKVALELGDAATARAMLEPRGRARPARPGDAARARRHAVRARRVARARATLYRGPARRPRGPVPRRGRDRAPLPGRAGARASSAISEGADEARRGRRSRSPRTTAAALLLRNELDADDPDALLADDLALATPRRPRQARRGSRPRRSLRAARRSRDGARDVSRGARPPPRRPPPAHEVPRPRRRRGRLDATASTSCSG